MYTKKQIADALIKFINNDLMNDIDDKHLKFSLSMSKKALKENPSVLDHFMKSPLVSSVIKESDGMYDVDVFAKTLKNVLSEYDEVLNTVIGYSDYELIDYILILICYNF